ncbi:MAG: hypothetical protein E7554_04245 [Ruminococcaceae bacterium]|nr:hypothetical protein [Oscillospiraceae bacterium]
MNIIDVLDNEIVVNGMTITFPASLQELTEALGTPRVVGEGEKASYIFDEMGLAFQNGSSVFLRKNKAFTDMDHLVMYCSIHVCDDGLLSGEHAARHYRGSVTFFGNAWERFNPFLGQQQAVWRDGEELKFSHIGVIMRGKDDEPDYIDGFINKNVYLSFKPTRPRSTEDYNIVQPAGECLEFDNFNFKLAVIQELMYEQEVLKPHFDLYDYLKFKKSRANTESPRNIKPAVDFFTTLRIPVSLAESVRSIDMDGGNEIYMNICPMWDGEDERFDLTAVSARELKQFPNLKHMTVMAAETFDAVRAAGEELGIEVEQI